MEYIIFLYKLEVISKICLQNYFQSVNTSSLSRGESKQIVQLARIFAINTSIEQVTLTSRTCTTACQRTMMRKEVLDALT